MEDRPLRQVMIQDKPQHIWYNEKSNMASSYVDLVQMADSTIARGNSNVFELNVHIVFGCAGDRSQSTVPGVGRTTEMRPKLRLRKGSDVPSMSLPLYTWPDVISSVTTWFWGTESVSLPTKN